MSDRTCRKCGNKIPLTVRINGIKKNLQNRKFCLECSPWGCHNTSSSDPVERKRKSVPYCEWSEEWKKSLIKSNYKRTTRRKEKLVEMSGGKCSVCGYNKCIKALAFHHKNRKEKLFMLNASTLAQHSWDDILKELAKCELICHNCHAEKH